MLKMRHIFAAFLFAAVIGNAVSQSPTQGQDKKPTDKANATNTYQRGTDSEPLIVKILPTPKTEAAAEEEKKEKDLKRRADEDLAIFTGNLAKYTKYLVGIGIVQVFIFVAQLIVFGMQAKRLRETIESQQRSERAHIYPGEYWSYLLPIGANALYPTANNVPLPSVVYRFFNIGRTAAIIEEFRTELFLFDNPPEFITYTDHSAVSVSATPLREGEWFPPEKFHPIKCEFLRNLTPAEIEKIHNGELRFFIRGFVKYRDIFGYSWERGFFFMCKDDSFFVWGDTYNYEKPSNKKRKKAYPTNEPGLSFASYLRNTRNR